MYGEELKTLTTSFCDSETSNLGKTERSGGKEIGREDVDLQTGAKEKEQRRRLGSLGTKVSALRER